jgi:hypothetical protein
MSHFGSNQDSVRTTSQKRFGFLAIFSSVIFFMLCFVSCYSVKLTSTGKDPDTNPHTRGKLFISRVDKELAVKYDDLPEEVSAALKDRKLDYYVFLVKDSQLYYWGRYLDYIFANYETTWRSLVASDDKDDRIRGNMLLPELDDCQMIYLFLRGKLPEPGEYYIPDETTEYAFRIFSGKDMDDLVQWHFWSNDSISYKDLDLDFKPEADVVQDDLLFMLVTLAFSKPGIIYYTSGMMVDFSSEYISYLESCAKYVDRLCEKRLGIGKKIGHQHSRSSSDSSIFLDESYQPVELK